MLFCIAYKKAISSLAGLTLAFVPVAGRGRGMEVGGMMDAGSFGAAVLAGMIYVLVPGPATLATLSLSVARGRAVAACFLVAHLVGDVVWAVLALLALAGVSRLGPGLFDLLGLACGAYLIWLGWKALRATEPKAGGPVVEVPSALVCCSDCRTPRLIPSPLRCWARFLVAMPQDWGCRRQRCFWRAARWGSFWPT